MIFCEYYVIRLEIIDKKIIKKFKFIWKLLIRELKKK